MKKNIIIAVGSIILITNLVSLSSDFSKYKKAYEYIINDTDNMDKSFKEYLNYYTLPNICVSNKVKFFSYMFFLDDIIHYEYSDTLREEYRSAFESRLLKELDSINYFEEYSDDNLLELNNCYDGKLKIYFTELDSKNRLRAKVKIVYPKNVVPILSGIELDYLFYFKNNKIIKVFSVELVS